MLYSTTSTLDGRPIQKYLGIVTGEAIMGANIIRDMFASVTDIVGGRSGAYEEKLEQARRVAFAEMHRKAEQMGANGIVGIDIDYEVLGHNGGMMMVCTSGTAVIYSKETNSEN
jgi:uncharacterized protein YbjQ (UPF0145 family)